MRIHVDKIASVTRNLRIQRTVTLTPTLTCEPGAVVAGRIVGEKTTYNQMEDVHGRMSILHDGDIIVGALGHRNALHGYEGLMPVEVEVGQRLQMLNLGGVIGHCVSHNPDVGAPFDVEILGQVLLFPEFQSRQGQPASVRTGAVKAFETVPALPVIYVAGTCMNAGKTAAACAIVRHLSQAGLKVGGAKLTGISLMRDILGMRDYGAEVVLDFTDAGVVCSTPETAPRVARTLFSNLAVGGVDVIVAETGDGIMGDYGVQAVLADADLMGLSAALVLCANDPVGVAGGVEHLQRSFGLRVDVVAGPATDNRVGTRFVEGVVGVPARNARTDAKGLGTLIHGLVEAKLGARV